MTELRNGLEMSGRFKEFDLNENVKQYFIDNFVGFRKNDKYKRLGGIYLDDSYESSVLKQWAKVYKLQILIGGEINNYEYLFPRNLEVNIANVYCIYPFDVSDNHLLFGFRWTSNIETTKFLGKYDVDITNKEINTNTFRGFARYYLERKISHLENLSDIFNNIITKLGKKDKK